MYSDQLFVLLSTINLCCTELCLLVIFEDFEDIFELIRFQTQNLVHDWGVCPTSES